MRFLFFFIFSFILNSSSLFAVGKTDLVLSEKGFSDTIRISYENGRIYVPIKINNQEYKFLFDTGARDFMLNGTNRNIVREKKDSILFRGFDKRERKVEYGFVQDFQFGGISFSNYNYAVIDVGMPLNCDGVWGAYRLFENGISCKIDIKDSIIILTDIKGMFDKEEGFDIPYKSNLKMRFNMSYGCSGWALFDTGANTFMYIDRYAYYDKSANGKNGDMFKGQIEWSDFGSSKRSVHGLENSNEHIFMNLKELKLGECFFCNMPIKASLGSTVVGCRILEYGNIIINPNQNKMRYQPYDSGKYIHIEKKNKDVVYSWDNGSFYVVMINENSDIYDQGLRKGYCLIEYNTYPISCMDDYLCAIRNTNNDLMYSAKFKNKTGDIIEIVFNR